MVRSPAQSKVFHGNNKLGMRLHGVGMKPGFERAEKVSPNRSEVIPKLFP
jgi:hypothetical protein